MKKYIFFPILFLAFAMTGYAQKSYVPIATAAQLKSGLQTRAAYDPSTGGNVFTTSLVGKLVTPLSLTATQQKSMNTALFNFFTQKNGFSKLRWSDQTAYQQQTNSLVQTLIGQLGAFLSPDQVSKFVAMKPASPRTQDPLVPVFY